MKKYAFNDRAQGIFIDKYQDSDGLPVGDTFAYSLKAALYGRDAREWTKDTIAVMVGMFSSEQMVKIMEFANNKLNDDLWRKAHQHGGLINDKESVKELSVLLGVEMSTAKKVFKEPLDFRAADQVIQDRSLYDAIEIQGVNEWIDFEDPKNSCCEVDNVSPSFYSVYVHLIPEGDNGGVECVGDFSDYQKAVEYAKELSKEYGWPVKDFTEHRAKPKPAKKSSTGMGM